MQGDVPEKTLGGVSEKTLVDARWRIGNLARWQRC